MKRCNHSWSNETKIAGVFVPTGWCINCGYVIEADNPIWKAIEKLKAENEKLREHVGHKDDCEMVKGKFNFRTGFFELQDKCTCKLSDLLSRIKSGGK